MQIKKVFLTLLMSISAFMSPIVAAHEGHDHSHWTSPILHALFLLSLAAVGLACVYALYKVVSRHHSQEP